MNGAFHGAVGAAMRYNLFTNERVLFDASPTSSDVMRGVVNYLFRYGSLTPEQWGYQALDLVDPYGSVKLEYDYGGGNTVVYFDSTNTTAANQQGFTLNCTPLFALYPSFTTNTWHCEIVFKLASALGNTSTCILFSPNGLNTVGLCLRGNNVMVRASDFLNKSWYTNTAPVSDGWAGADHRILVINNSDYLSVYVDGTLQLMKDSLGSNTATSIELGRVTAPLTPPVAEWMIGNTAAHVNTMTFHLSSTTDYVPMFFKYVQVGDALTDPVLLNATINLDAPDQIDSFTIDQVRPAFVVKSTQEDDSVQGYKYPVNIGLQYGDAGAIDLYDENTRIFYAGPDGVSGGNVCQAVISENCTLDPRFMNVQYAVRTNLTAVTVKMPTFNRAYPGTWLYFYDIDGGAGSKNLTIDPDNANTGYTINGNTTPQTAIASEWGGVELFYDWYGNTDKNWIMVKHAPSDFAILQTSANATVSVPNGPGMMIYVSTGTSASKTITLPLANTCPGKQFYIKKADDGNREIVVDASGTNNFDMPGTTSDKIWGKHNTCLYVSEGTSYWKTHRLHNHGSEAIKGYSGNSTLDVSYDTFWLSGNSTITLPLAINTQGRVFWCHVIGNNVITIDPSGSETIDNVATLTLKGKHKSIGLMTQYGSDWSTIGYVNDQVATATTNSTIAYPARVVLANANAGSITLTLPLAANYGERYLTIKKVDTSANTVTIDGNGAETIDGVNTYVLNLPNQVVELSCNGTSWSLVGVSEQMNDLTVDNAATIYGTLNTVGAVTFGNTLNVEGATQLNSTLNATGAVIFGNTLNTTGAVVFGSTLNTTGAVVFGSTLNTTGAVIFSNTLNVEGAVQLNSTFNTTGVVTFSNTVNVNTVNGIDYNPGSDTDLDLITVGVTGTPRLWWFEAGSQFRFTENLVVEPATDVTFTGSDAQSLSVYMTERSVDGNESNPHAAIRILPSSRSYDIAAGVTDSGHRTPLAFAGYVSNANFEGTLAGQYGLYLQSGILTNCTGTINTCHGASIILYGLGTGATINNAAIYYGAYGISGTTVNNAWGIYIEGETKNYLSGNLGLGITPTSKLHVNGTSNIVGAALFGNAVNVNTADGIDVNPGSDVNTDLITVGVTSAPNLKWRADVNSFQLRGGLVIDPADFGGGIGTWAFYPVMAGKVVNADETNYLYIITSGTGPYSYYINTGVTDSGWRAGLAFNYYVDSADFKGTLAAQHGIRLVGGIYNGTGTINNSYGFSSVFVQSAGTVGNACFYHGSYIAGAGTITNKWGLYLDGETNNYLSGNLGLGITPTSKLHVNGTSNIVGSALFGNAVNVNTTNGIDFNPGSDVNTDLVTVGVTGTPKFFWEESLSQFGFDAPLVIRPTVAATANSTFWGLYVYAPGYAVNTNSTNYGYGIQQRPSDLTYNIANGVVDSGMRAGLSFGHYVNDSNFLGRLAAQIGASIETGIHVGSGYITTATGLMIQCYQNDGTVDNARAIYVSYPGGTGTITAKWGLHINGETSNYLSGELQVGGVVKSGKTQTITGNATLNTNATLVLCNIAANATLTLPAAASNDGRDLYVKRLDSDAAVLSVDGNSAELVEGVSAYDITGHYTSVHFRCDGTGWWIVAKT